MRILNWLKATIPSRQLLVFRLLSCTCCTYQAIILTPLTRELSVTLYPNVSHHIASRRFHLVANLCLLHSASLTSFPYSLMPVVNGMRWEGRVVVRRRVGEMIGSSLAASMYWLHRFVTRSSIPLGWCCGLHIHVVLKGRRWHPTFHFGRFRLTRETLKTELRYTWVVEVCKWAEIQIR